MKRLTALILTLVIVCSLICSCGEKAGEFVAIDKDNLYTMSWVSGGTNTVEGEALEKVIEAYNALSPDGAVTKKLDEKAEWRIVATVTPEDANPTIFRISYIGDYRFCVMVDGASSSSYTVTSEALYNAFIETK